MKNLIASVVAALLAIPPVYMFGLKDYQKNRIRVLDPNYDPYGAGYNVRQSKIAVGSGRLWGRVCSTAPKASSTGFRSTIPTTSLL